MDNSIAGGVALGDHSGGDHSGGDDSGGVLDVVALVCVREGRVLMVRPRHQGTFYLPGGKIEPGETEVDALVREVGEELTVGLDRDGLRFFERIDAPAYGERPGTEVRLRCYLGEIDGSPTPAAEIADVRHLSREDYLALPDTAPAIVRLLDRLRDRGHVA